MDSRGDTDGIEMPQPDAETQCCFCSGTIERTVTDPCTFVFSLAWGDDADRDLLPDQQFFCHLSCFRARLAKGMQVYFAKDELEDAL